MPLLHIGFDDTDSRKGMCTTYLAYRIVDFLLKRNAKFLDHPLLIRLNPNIPWKTRGNGAVALRVEIDNEEIVMDGIKSLVECSSHVGSGANPGLVFYSGETVPDDVREFAMHALHDVMSRNKAKEIAEKHGMYAHTFGNGQGIVGALSAIGTILDKDHTFEIIAYRKHENCCKLREISEKSIIAMTEKTYPQTYNNYDYKHERILITPRGSDPIFCGIRGEDPDVLLQAFQMLDITEDLEGYMTFRTNHGTNMHLTHQFDLSNLKTYTSGYVRGRVASNPYAIEGGHTFFTVSNEHGSALCGIYEPTGLSQLAQKLSAGDMVEIGGGVRKATSKHQKVINVEYIRILQLSDKFEYVNPLCKKCGKRLKSDGMNKGYKCERCGIKERNAQKIAVQKPREIKEGLYIPVPKAQRHLTKPFHRYGMEKSKRESFSDGSWYFKFSDNDPIHLHTMSSV